MDGVNEVGEVKVSRLQMEGETAPEHKVEDERRRRRCGVSRVVVQHGGFTKQDERKQKYFPAV